MSHDRPRRFGLIAAAMALVAASCSDDGPMAPSPAVATVTFVYQSTIPSDPTFNPDSLGCIRGILPFTVHMFAGWRGFGLVEMSPVPDGRSYRTIVNDVPAGPNVIIMVDPAMCNVDPSSVGSVTERIFANGALLTNVVRDVNAAGMNGLSFTVTADGFVSP